MSDTNTNPHSFPAGTVINAPDACRIGALEQRIAELESRVAELEHMRGSTISANNRDAGVVAIASVGSIWSSALDNSRPVVSSVLGDPAVK